MTASVRKLQHHGLMVSGGFIVGFDNDPPTIFEQQIQFIQKSGIVTAMVGLLNAPAGTALFKRLKAENRLLNQFGGDNMDGTTNIIPKMKYQHLIRGYKKVLDVIYSQKEFYERLKLFLSEYHVPGNRFIRINFDEFKAFFKSFWFLGVREKGKRYYWRLLGVTLLKFPKKLPLAVTLAIYGFHFRRIVEKI